MSLLFILFLVPRKFQAHKLHSFLLNYNCYKLHYINIISDFSEKKLFFSKHDLQLKKQWAQLIAVCHE